jgi:hypothetical protein
MEWRTDLVFSLNRNEIVSITGEMVDVLDANGKVIGQKEANDTNNGWFIGQPKDVIWDYKILGTWKTGQEEDAAKWGQSPGDFILEDVDADGLLTDADKQFLGIKSPRYSWALTNTFTLFKDFDISFVVYSLWGRKAAFNLAKHDNHVEDRMNSRDIPYWTPDNQMDDFARLRSAPAKGVTYSAWFDQSYIRLENFSIGYRVPAGLFGKTSISNLRVTLNVRNVGFWAPVWKFSDPEDGTRAPKIFTLGINMSL